MFFAKIAKAEVMIEILQYSALSNWAFAAPSSNFSAQKAGLNVYMLSSLLRRVMEPVVIQDDEMYARLTIRSGGAGVTVRMRGGRKEKIRGKDIGRKNQFRVHAGQLVVSSIDARNGAAGIVPEDAEGCVVTDNFWVFIIDENMVVPSFLQQLLARPGVTSQIKAISHGTTNRQYITIDQFLKVTVALPNKIEQKNFLAQYRSLQERRLELQSDIDSFGVRRESVISRFIGNSATHLANNGSRLFSVEYQNMHKWNSIRVDDVTLSMHAVRIRDCIAEIMTMDSKSLKMKPQMTPLKNYHYIGMADVEKDIGLLVDKPKSVKGAEIKSTSIKVPKGYIIYGKLRPYLNKFWMNNTIDENVICSSEFLVFCLSHRVDLNYFVAMLGSRCIQNQIVDKLIGSRMPRLSTSDFLDLWLPEPSIAIQKQLGTEIMNLRCEVSANRVILKQLSESRVEELFNEFGV